RTPNTALLAAHRPAAATTTTAKAASTTTAKGATTTTKPGTTTTTTKKISCRTLLTPKSQQKASASVVLPAKDPVGACYELGPTVLTGKRVKTASASYGQDSSGSGWGVDATFRGDDFVQKVATPFVGKQVAIELDGVVQSAPTINPGITGRTVRI